MTDAVRSLVRYSVINCSNPTAVSILVFCKILEWFGRAERISFLYSAACSTVSIGGSVLGIIIPRPNLSAVYFVTARKVAPRRRCTWESKGRFMVIDWLTRLVYTMQNRSSSGVFAYFSILMYSFAMAKDVAKQAIALHKNLGGKIRIQPAAPVRNRADLSLVYTP